MSGLMMMAARPPTPTFAPGAKVTVYGKNTATVTSTHAKGKRVSVLFDSGKTSFVSASACKPVTA